MPLASRYTKASATGAGAVAATTGAVPTGAAYRLVSVTAHFGVAPAAAGSLTVTLDAQAGAAYDTVLQSASMVGLTDWAWFPDSPIVGVTGDTFIVAYANSDSRTYGVQITTEAV